MDLVKNDTFQTIGSAVISGIGDYKIGELYVENVSKKIITGTIGGGNVFGPGFGLRGAVETLSSSLGRKAASGAGVLSILSFGWDVYQDTQKYEGVNLAKAITVDTGALGAGIGAGIMIAAAPIELPVVASIGAGIVIGVVIGNVADSIKEKWCK